MNLQYYDKEILGEEMEKQFNLFLHMSFCTIWFDRKILNKNVVEIIKSHHDLWKLGHTHTHVYVRTQAPKFKSLKT